MALVDAHSTGRCKERKENAIAALGTLCHCKQKGHSRSEYIVRLDVVKRNVDWMCYVVEG